MSYSKSAASKRASLIILLVNLFSFLLFYVFEYLTQIEFIIGVVSYVTSFIGSVIPILITVFSLFTYNARSFGRASLSILFFTLYRLIYLLPYYYIFYFESGYDTSDSIILSLMHSFLILLVTYIECIILLSVAIFITRKISGNDKGAIEKGLPSANPFNLSEPLTLGIFTCVAFKFLTNFIEETVQTVKFLINYSGNIRFGEILTISLSYVFILFVFLASQFSAIKLKSYVFRYAEKEDEDAE